MSLREIEIKVIKIEENHEEIKMDRLGIRKSPYQNKKNMVGDFQIKELELSKIVESNEWHDSEMNSPHKVEQEEPDSNRL